MENASLENISANESVETTENQEVQTYTKEEVLKLLQITLVFSIIYLQTDIRSVILASEILTLFFKLR